MMRCSGGAAFIFILTGVLAASSLFAPVCFGRDEEITPQMQLALTNERELAETLPGIAWSEEYVAEAAARIASFPDQAACELLWVFASAPPEVETAAFFSGALSSVSPRVRIAALVLLIGEGSEGALRMADVALSMEKDPEVIRVAAEAKSDSGIIVRHNGTAPRLNSSISQ